jgi:hypothetical protein
MSHRYSEALLRRLRNDIPIDTVLRDHLHIPWKVSEGIFRFLCPLCSDFHTATNPRTNLARCFRCQRNFNPIDIVMLVEGIPFRDTVVILRRMLPNDTRHPPANSSAASKPAHQVSS